MIKASELRKGNIIGWRTGFGELIIGTVYEVHADKVAIGPETIIDDNSSGQSFMTLNGIEPIPLTPEWLERCGFHKLNAGWINASGSICFYDKSQDINGYYAMDYGTRNYNARFKYVHQLQNLYFALTGEELEIKY